MFIEIVALLSWLLLGMGLLLDVTSLVLLIRAVRGTRVPSGVPGVSLVLYLLWYGIRTLMGLPWFGGLLLGLVLLHVLVHLGLPLALRKARP